MRHIWCCWKVATICARLCSLRTTMMLICGVCAFSCPRLDFGDRPVGLLWRFRVLGHALFSLWTGTFDKHFIIGDFHEHLWEMVVKWSEFESHWSLLREWSIFGRSICFKFVYHISTPSFQFKWNLSIKQFFVIFCRNEEDIFLVVVWQFLNEQKRAISIQEKSFSQFWQNCLFFIRKRNGEDGETKIV